MLMADGQGAGMSQIALILIATAVLLWLIGLVQVFRGLTFAGEAVRFVDAPEAEPIIMPPTPAPRFIPPVVEPEPQAVVPPAPAPTPAPAPEVAVEPTPAAPPVEAREAPPAAAEPSVEPVAAVAAEPDPPVVAAAEDDDAAEAAVDEEPAADEEDVEETLVAEAEPATPADLQRAWLAMLGASDGAAAAALTLTDRMAHRYAGFPEPLARLAGAFDAVFYEAPELFQTPGAHEATEEFARGVAGDGVQLIWPAEGESANDHETHGEGPRVTALMRPGFRCSLDGHDHEHRALVET
jgi:hypothetical protein